MILRGDSHVVYHFMDPITLENGTTGTRDGFIPAWFVANHLPFLVNCDKGGLHQRRPDPEMGFNKGASSLHGPTSRSTMHPLAISTQAIGIRSAFGITVLGIFACNKPWLHFQARGNASAATRRCILGHFPNHTKVQAHDI